MADEKTRVEQYRDLTRQAQAHRWNPNVPHDANWQNHLDTFHDQAVPLAKQMTPDERDEAGLTHAPKAAPQRTAERSNDFTKLLTAGASLTGGVIANRALTREETPPPPQVHLQLIPTVPMPVEEEKPDTLAMNVRLRERERVR